MFSDPTKKFFLRKRRLRMLIHFFRPPLAFSKYDIVIKSRGRLSQ